MYEALAIGDLHMDKMTKLWSDANSVILSDVRRVLDWGLEQGINRAVFLGDIAHKERMSYDAHLGLIELAADYDGRMEIDFLIGNHDFGEQGVNSVELLQRLAQRGAWQTIRVHGTSAQLLQDGVYVNFLAWPDRQPLPTPDGHQPLNYGHFEVAGAIGDNGRVLKDGEAPAPRHKFVNGHLHTPHDHGGVHFAGTLYQTSFGERPEKSFTVVRAYHAAGKKKLTLDCERIAFRPTLRLRNLTVNQPADLDKVTDRAYTLWRLLLAPDVTIPDRWLLEHPTVIKIEGWTSANERQALEREEWVPIAEQIPVIDELDLLAVLLTEEQGLSPDEVKTALDMLVKEIR